MVTLISNLEKINLQLFQGRFLIYEAFQKIRHY